MIFRKQMLQNHAKQNFFEILMFRGPMLTPNFSPFAKINDLLNRLSRFYFS